MHLRALVSTIGFSITFHDGKVVEFPKGDSGAVELSEEQGRDLAGLTEVDSQGEPLNPSEQTGGDKDGDKGNKKGGKKTSGGAPADGSGAQSG